MVNMSRLTHVFLAVTLLVLSVNAVRDGCPDFILMGPWGCAYMPKCFGDSMCPAGQQCCSHPCGDQCAAIVHCKSLKCGGKVCAHGFQRGADGCQTCDCLDLCGKICQQPVGCRGLPLVCDRFLLTIIPTVVVLMISILKYFVI